MSHIFDALQRAEAESTGAKRPTFSLATELLEAAEQKMQAAGGCGAARTEDAGSHGGRGAARTENAAATAVMEQPVRADSFATRSSGTFEDLEQCPVLAVSVPEESHLVAVDKEESLGAEKFRFLAVRLRQLRQSRSLKKVLITSTIPQEGKSTVAANLACTLARRKQHKTLLLEGDLRRPTVAHKLGFGQVPGLCEWLRGETESMNVYRIETLGLWVLPAGNAPENPLELMQSGKLAPLMEQLTEWFDWIIIDSPPVLPLADTSIWARLSDGILLVTRNGTTERQHLQRGLESLEKSKLLGALVNNSANAAHSDYYQRYSSSSIHANKEKPKPVKKS
jgi:capsular exopolysaccharide synthesis family protein